jgi:hypothetical protein
MSLDTLCAVGQVSGHAAGSAPRKVDVIVAAATLAVELLVRRRPVRIGCGHGQHDHDEHACYSDEPHEAPLVTVPVGCACVKHLQLGWL